jgi:hypothetical protein
MTSTPPLYIPQHISGISCLKRAREYFSIADIIETENGYAGIKNEDGDDYTNRKACAFNHMLVPYNTDHEAISQCNISNEGSQSSDNFDTSVTLMMEADDIFTARGVGRLCNEPACEKFSRGTSGKCTSHGGGRRCNELGCVKPSRCSSGKCIAHGGGQRCNSVGCERLSQGSTNRCQGERQVRSTGTGPEAHSSFEEIG